MDPTVLGNVGGRTVKGPPDAQAWLHSVIGGLRNTGIAVEFGDAETTVLSFRLNDQERGLSRQHQHCELEKRPAGNSVDDRPSF